MTASAMLAPLYARAFEQASVPVALEHAPASGSELRLASTGILPDTNSGTEDTVPPLTAAELAALVPAGLRDYFTAPIAATSVLADSTTPGKPPTRGPLVWRAGGCDHVTLRSGRCPTAAGEIAVSTSDAANFGWRTGTRLPVDEVRLGVSFMPHGGTLVSTLTAAENVLVPLLAAGVAPPEARGRAEMALGAVGLGEEAGHLPEELSGGQQQRVAAAALLATGRRVLLLDEPTSELDAGNRQRVLAALRAQADAGAIVIVATHDPEAAAPADAELVLDEGVATWARALPGGAVSVPDV